MNLLLHLAKLIFQASICLSLAPYSPHNKKSITAAVLRRLAQLETMPPVDIDEPTAFSETESTPATASDGLFVRGISFLPTSSSTTADIPLPRSVPPDLNWIVFTGIFDLAYSPPDTQIPSYSVESGMVQGSTFKLTYKTTCQHKDHETSVYGPMINWLLVKSGVYEYYAETEVRRLAAGIVKIASTERSVQVHLIHPTDPAEPLFSSQPVVLLQVQDSSSVVTTIGSILRVKYDTDPNYFTIEVVYQPDELYGPPVDMTIGYMAVFPGTYTSTDANTSIDIRLIPYDPVYAYAFDVGGLPPQCNRITSYGATLQGSTYTAQEFSLLRIDHAATSVLYGSSSLTSHFMKVNSIVCPGVPGMPVDWASVGVISFMDRSFCASQQSTLFGFGTVSNITDPNIVVEEGSDTTLILICVFGILGVLGIFGACYYCGGKGKEEEEVGPGSLEAQGYPFGAPPPPPPRLGPQAPAAPPPYR